MTDTPWTTAIVEDTTELMTAGRYRAALGALLPALMVHPESAEVRRVASMLLYLGGLKDAAEPLTFAEMFDTRLDALFCGCEGTGCGKSWMSAGSFVDGATTVMNPRGGRCDGCGGYFCRDHFGPRGGCPRCGGRIDGAPAVPNGRRAAQMVRLNQPLVHLLVLREAPGAVPPDFMNELLTAVAPDVFEDGPTLTLQPVGRWPDDWTGLAMAFLAKDDYLGDGHDLRFQDGTDRAGVRWGIAKVFAAMPKYVDPDDSAVAQDGPPATDGAPPPPAAPPPAAPPPAPEPPAPEPRRRWFRRRG